MPICRKTGGMCTESGVNYATIPRTRAVTIDEIKFTYYMFNDTARIGMRGSLTWLFVRISRPLMTLMSTWELGWGDSSVRMRLEAVE